MIRASLTLAAIEKRSFRPCRWVGRISLRPWFGAVWPKTVVKPPKPSSCQTLVQGLGLTLVLGSGPVFLHPSPRQTSLEARRCKIEEGAELDWQEPAGWINEAHRQGRWPVLVEHRGQRFLPRWKTRRDTRTRA